MVPSIRGVLKKARKKSVKAVKPIKKKIKSHVTVPDTQRKPGGPAPFVPKPGGSRPIEKPSIKPVKKRVKKATKKTNPRKVTAGHNPMERKKKSTKLSAIKQVQLKKNIRGILEINKAKKNLKGIEDHLKELEGQLNALGDDAQLANVDMQNWLQKQQQTLQTISNVSKMLHDTAMAIIRKIG